MYIKLFDQEVGEGRPTFIIAEVGLNHNGSMEIAKKLIDVAVESGCNAVKFQKRDVKNLAINSFLDSPDLRFPEFGNTYREVREFVEFSNEELLQLKEYADKRKIHFFLTPFDLESAKTVEKLDLAVVKSASHNLTFIPLIRTLVKRKRPLIISTGMSTLEELDHTVSIVREADCPFALLHCVSAYPTPLELVNLKLIDFLKERYQVPVGYSGHEEYTSNSQATLAAVARGACIVERHITLDNNMIGFDHKISLNPESLKSLVNSIRNVDRMMGNGIKKLLPEEKIKRDQQRISIATKVSIRKGTKIEESMLVYKGPGTGFASYDLPKIIGQVAKVDIPEDILILPEMIG
ncbi:MULTISPECIES: N-acetylneuraminate synthase family protein [Leptospira]|uniref:N-acetylneuraminate synthase family protein n=1 Tax=Leptospira TaxID=171 RepID=UPI0002BB0C7A|nr:MULTISPECIES: N-acetylneuraminate synthase family protein [Leptospira]EMO28585.1 NeuB family protein [Leptospira interrogans serovar Bataviae str. HAI135]EMS85327.1 NeuB family protein [Leptospira noguchii str. Cascata]MCR8648655.1 NeuB family protein [Leptospira interrogans serovar Bataviae]OAM73305.1 NeuB family protein [Leptospira interrogans serovar Bataviae]QOI38158.1 NeuB family protein [Leptospira interrogans serovar Bataviae]